MPRAVHPLRRISNVARPIEHDVADNSAHPPAGKSVVADVRNAIRGKILLADSEDLLLHFRRHPRIDAVGDDVIKRAKLWPDLHDVHAAELNVLQANLLDIALPV